MAKRRIYPSSIKSQIETLYLQEKLTQRQIAQKLGISHGSIAWLIRKFHVKGVRPEGFQRGQQSYPHKKGKESPSWKGGQIERICSECGIIFFTFPSTAIVRCENCRKHKNIRRDRKEITNKRFGKLIAIKREGFDKNGHLQWLCKCDCGLTKRVNTSNLIRGTVKSCGCSRKDAQKHRRKEKIHVKCFYCGKEKYIYPSHANACSKFFCHETNCKGKWQKESGITRGKNSGKWKGGPQSVKCDNCGEEIKKRICSLKSYSKHFCNNKCSGEWQSKNNILGRNPNWNGGKSFEPYPMIWNEQLREMIRDRDNRKCQLCNIPENGDKLPVHHKDYDKDNCDPLNLISLCHDCHIKTNFNREHWKEYFQSQPSLALVVN